MRFKFSFYLDKRFKLENGEHSIKVNCYSYAEKKNYHFRIKPKITSDFNKIILSCKNQDEFDSIWAKKNITNSFGEITGEKTVYGRKLEIRTVLKEKQDRLNDIIKRSDVISIADVKKEFHKEVDPVNISNNVYLAFESKIKKTRNLTTQSTYRNALKSIFSYNNPSIKLTKNNFDKEEDRVRLFNNYPFKFDSIDKDWLKDYERYRRENVSVSTVGIELRNLRHLYNTAKDELTHLEKKYPFKNGMYSIPKSETRNQSLTNIQIKMLMHFESGNTYLQMARDFWIFSYINRGINLKDVAYFKKGQKEYIRKKTEFSSKTVRTIKLIEHPLLDAIIERQKGTGKYMFNILDDYDDEATSHKKIQNKTSSLNKQYKRLAQELGFPSGFSYQWARHSFTTNSIRAGIDLTVISQTMGHTSEATTRKYVDTLVDENENKINQALGI